MDYRVLLATVACLLGLVLACGGGSAPSPSPSPVAPAPAPSSPGSGKDPVDWDARVRKVTFKANGTSRSAYVHLPEGHGRTGEALPVILAFHGGKNSSGRAVGPHWWGMVDRGYVLVFPNGQSERPEDPAWSTEPGDMSDVRVVRALLEELEKRVRVDHARIYAVGFSNGGHQTFMLGCYASELFAGMAVISHSMHPHVAQSCSPSKPLPLLYLFGTADDAWSKGLGAEDSLAHWLRLHGCRREPTVTESLRDAPGDDTHVTRYVYDRCKGSSGVEFLKIHGGGHSWPGPRHKGKGHCTDIDATQEMVAFFQRRAGL